MEGLPDDEKEGWRLFQQLLDALVHMSALNILHRDIKLNNIFIGNSFDLRSLKCYHSWFVSRHEGRLQR